MTKSRTDVLAFYTRYDIISYRTIQNTTVLLDLRQLSAAAAGAAAGSSTTATTRASSSIERQQERVCVTRYTSSSFLTRGLTRYLVQRKVARLSTSSAILAPRMISYHIIQNTKIELFVCSKLLLPLTSDN